MRSPSRSRRPCGALSQPDARLRSGAHRHAVAAAGHHRRSQLLPSCSCSTTSTRILESARARARLLERAGHARSRPTTRSTRINANKLMIPASNMKIVTLAAAAEKLGWDYRYETQLVATGSIVSGTLDGDLVVVGSGDPTLDDHRGNRATIRRLGRRGQAARHFPHHRTSRRRRNRVREPGIRLRLVVGRPAGLGRGGSRRRCSSTKTRSA